MQKTWSYLLLAFGLAALQVIASLTQNAAMAPPTANPTATESSSFPETIVDAVPTVPTLTIVSDRKAVAPTPGSVIVLNGIPTRILSNTRGQNSHILADTANIEHNSDPLQPWNTSYPGPIREADWLKYLAIWDPVWWSQNLDSLRQVSCSCAAEDYYSNPQAHLTAYMHFEYYSHQLGNMYALDWACGPTISAIDIEERGTDFTEHCWMMVTGEMPKDSRMDKTDYCDNNNELCVKPWRHGKRSLKFHDHKRNLDYGGIHRWSEVRQVVRDVCRPICKDKFQMMYDDTTYSNPSFVTSWYPPKPIDLTVIGN